jgi:precorrin-2 dehydrogenase/sirohydrochlorin ferrochelatase
VSRFAYPVTLDVSGKRAVVIGPEAVAAGKVDALSEAGAEVTVIEDAFRPEQLDGAFVCVASSSDPEERRAIYEAGRARGVLVNVMDDPEHCDFAAPAVVRRGDLTIAIATGGRSPALARRLREELERRYGEEWAEIMDVIGQARAETLASLPDLRDRIRRWKEALDLDEVESLVREGRAVEAKQRLRNRLVGVGS